jgi:redox-sensitive bicupin YhaK (pirin superfamily)
VISGEVQGIQGPVQDIVVDTEYLDVTLSPDTTFEHQVKTEYNAFVYVFEGKGYFDPDKTTEVRKEHLVLFEKGDSVKITATTETLRFLFVAGKPLNEPVAWRGPIVMNTQAELAQAFEEYRDGTFIKHNRK